MQLTKPKIFITIAIIAAIFAIFLLITDTPGAIAWIQPQSSTAQLINSEVNFYESEFNVELLPFTAEIGETNTTTIEIGTSNATAEYFEGMTYSWQNSTGHTYSAQNRARLRFYQEEPTQLTIRHELCHHYLRSHCNLSENYGLYKRYGGVIKNEKSELPHDFEESFCEGFATKSLNQNSLAPQNYQFLKDMPLEFFNCGLNTCNPLECYSNQSGKSWNTNI